MRILSILLASRPVLILVFYLIVLPAGLFMRSLGRDPMARRRDRKADSYRVASLEQPPADMERD